MTGVMSFFIWLLITIIWTLFDYDKSKSNIIFRYIFTFIGFSFITWLLSDSQEYINTIFFYSGWFIVATIFVCFFKNVKLINWFYLASFIITSLIKIFM